MTQIDIIKGVQTIAGPALDPLVISITNLGSEAFYTLLVPFLFWCVNKSLGFGTGIAFSAAVISNDWIKGLAKLPRPDPSQVRVVYPESGPGYGFPSGHTQGTAAAWLYISLISRKKAVMWFAACAVAAVGLSRLYLGLHFPTDVLGGLVFGAVAAVAVFALRKLSISSLALQTLASLAIPPLALFLTHSDDVFKLVGLVMGFSLGYVYEEKYVNFKIPTSYLTIAIRFAAGILVLFAIKAALKAVFPDMGVFHCFRYLVMGLWVTLGAPLMFRKIEGSD